MIADRLTVFRDGAHVITAPYRMTTEQIIHHMVGRESPTLSPKSD